MLIWERRGHARDRRLGGLLYGLFGGMGGGGEENGGLHGAVVLQPERRATCRSHVLNLLAYREVRASMSDIRGARRDAPPGPSGFPSQAAHPHSRAPPTRPRGLPAGARRRRTRKHDTGAHPHKRDDATRKGRSRPRLPYFGRSEAIAAFTRFDERHPVAWASKVPIIKLTKMSCSLDILAERPSAQGACQPDRP